MNSDSTLPTIYGIKACSTMKKARDWLETEGIAYGFHDYKSRGVDREKLATWCALHGWQKILNRAGTTFRRLDEARQSDLDEAAAIALMLEQPSMIKRPVLELDGQTLVGFQADAYAAAFKHSAINQ